MKPERRKGRPEGSGNGPPANHGAGETHHSVGVRQSATTPETEEVIADVPEAECGLPALYTPEGEARAIRIPKAGGSYCARSPRPATGSGTRGPYDPGLLERDCILVPTIRPARAPRGRTPLLAAAGHWTTVSAISALTVSAKHPRLGPYRRSHPKKHI